MGSSGGLLWKRYWTLRLLQIPAISWLDERPSALRGGLNSVELVTGVFLRDKSKNWNEMWALFVHISYANSYVYKRVRQKEVVTIYRTLNNVYGN